MSELELQKKISKELKKISKIKKITTEKVYISGVSDIYFEYNNKTVIAEVKLKPNLKVIKQLVRQRFSSEYLIAYTLPPKKEETKEKWKRIAIENNINLIFFNDKKLNFDNLILNPDFSRRYAEAMNKSWA